MPNNLKIIPTIIVITVVIGGGVLYFLNSSPFSSEPSLTANESNMKEKTPIRSSELSPSQNKMNDSSDAALDTDVATIDASMKDLDTDSTRIDEGLNDKQITQGQ